MRRASALLLAALLVVSCGGDGAAEEIGASTTTAVPPTTAVPATTAAPATTTTTVPATTATTAAPATTTTAPTTTTAAPTTTTEAEEDAWVDGSTVLRVGDCFVEVPSSGEDSTGLEAAPCDTPHLGEVVGIGSVCPAGIDRAEFTALASAYVGVAEDEFFDWMTGQQITGSSRVRFDDGLLVGTMCFLLAEEGDLTRSYRAASG